MIHNSFPVVMDDAIDLIVQKACSLWIIGSSPDFKLAF
jgi:hypothetical protein